MKNFRAAFGIASVFLLLLPSLGTAQDKQKEKAATPSTQSQSKNPPTTGNVPIYKPPLRGAPGGRVGGGTRGAPDRSVVLSVLTPDHSGLTTQEQPSLYWYLSQPTTYPIELTINEGEVAK